MTAVCADTRLEDYLTTKSVKYGKNAEIVIQVKQHPENEIELLFVSQAGVDPEVIKIPAGNGYFKANKPVDKGWSAEIRANNIRIDRETARRKTGKGRIE